MINLITLCLFYYPKVWESTYLAWQDFCMFCLVRELWFKPMQSFNSKWNNKTKATSRLFFLNITCRQNISALPQSKRICTYQESVWKHTKKPLNYFVSKRAILIQDIWTLCIKAKEYEKSECRLGGIKSTDIYQHS